MNARCHTVFLSLVFFVVSCVTIQKAHSATVTYRVHSSELGFDFVSVVELSEAAEVQPSGAVRFYALSASLQSDTGLSLLPPSDYQNTYVEIFGSNEPQFIEFSFDFPSSLGTGFSSARISIGNSGGLGGLGSPDPTDIRIFREDWDHSSNDGLAIIGAYLTTTDGINVPPSFGVEILEVIPEPATTLLGVIGVFGFLHRRRRVLSRE